MMTTITKNIAVRGDCISLAGMRSKPLIDAAQNMMLLHETPVETIKNAFIAPQISSKFKNEFFHSPPELIHSHLVSTVLNISNTSFRLSQSTEHEYNRPLKQLTPMIPQIKLNRRFTMITLTIPGNATPSVLIETLSP